MRNVLLLTLILLLLKLSLGYIDVSVDAFDVEEVDGELKFTILN